MILLALYATVNFKNFSKKKFILFLPLILYFVWTTISLTYSKNQEIGLNKVLYFSPLLIFPFIFSTFEIKKQFGNLLIHFLILSCFASIVYTEFTIVSRILHQNESLFLIFRKDFSYIELSKILNIHPPYYSLIVSFCIIYIINCYRNLYFGRIISVTLTLIMFVFVVHLSSRMAILSLIFVGLVSLYNVHLTKFRLSKRIFILFIIGFCISLTFYNIRATKNRFLEVIGMQYASGLYIKSGPSKIKQWQSGIEANNNFLFGNGIGDSKNSIIESNIKNNLIPFAERKYNAHNQFIETYVGLGFIGLCLLLYMIYFAYTSSNNKTLMFSFITYILLAFQTESYFERQRGLFFVLFVFCLIGFKFKRNRLTS